MTVYARRSARVLLLDSADRVLLIRSTRVAGNPARGHDWLTPGGGVERNEDLAVAAARELREEVGLAVAPAGLRPVAYTSGHADLGWAKGLFRDDFFLHRVDSHEVDTTGQTSFERRHYAGHRWWTLPELAITAETIAPFGLVDLVSAVVTGAAPATPIRLPWHHG